MSQQDRLRDAMLVALFDKYVSLRSDWAEAMDPDEFEEVMPVVSTVDGFRNLIGLSNIHVLTIEKDGRAYIGFEFGCTWDVEHGLGVMTHGVRVVEVDDAVSSFQNWGAERDMESGGGTAAV